MLFWFSSHLKNLKTRNSSLLKQNMVYAESCIQAIFKGFGDLPILIRLSVCDQVFGVFLLSPRLKQAHTLPRVPLGNFKGSDFKSSF